VRLLFPALLTILFAGCSVDPVHIDTEVTLCCDTTHKQSFSVVAENLPAFLGPMIVGNFRVAFANLGMEPVTSNEDLVVELRYEQIDLKTEHGSDDVADRDPLGEVARFIARIAIEVRDAETGMLLWAGHLQRLHDVGPGEWMHSDIASLEILNAFGEVLKHYKR
jgi:hypothetical protein